MSNRLFPVLAIFVWLTVPLLSADDFLDELIKKAEAGKAQDQLVLGVAYHSGKHIAKNYIEAMKWFRKAAEQGDATAQYFLGLIYVNGEGIEKDYMEAMKWFRKAAKQGDAAAQHSIGLMYYNGEGVEKD